MSRSRSQIIYSDNKATSAKTELGNKKGSKYFSMMGRHTLTLIQVILCWLYTIWKLFQNEQE